MSKAGTRFILAIEPSSREGWPLKKAASSCGDLLNAQLWHLCAGLLKHHGINPAHGSLADASLGHVCRQVGFAQAHIRTCGIVILRPEIVQIMNGLAFWL
jgi:hypothetical protein